MNAGRACPECGAMMTEETPDRLCAACTLRSALIEGNGPAPRVPYFGDYELIKEIARGGMGVVYKARQTSLNRTVALKMILKGQLATEADVRRFRAEGEAAAQLQHPNIVAIHEIGQFEGQHYFSMDFVDGPNLAELTAAGMDTPERAAERVKILAEAIEYAHRKGILHRDLKPSNILVDEFGEPRITDFGLAKRLEKGGELTVSGQVLGTPSFMPPEQIGSERGAVDARSDVYSLGAILYFLLTGKPPFSGETMHETLNSVIHEEPAAPRSVNPTIPRDLEVICLRCLEKKPAHRYSSAREFADDLGRFLMDEPIRARPINPFEKLCRIANRHRLATMLTLAVTVLICVVLGQLRVKRGGATNSRPIAPMPMRSGQGVSGLIDGKVYIMTPADGYPGVTNLFHLFDPKLNEWKRLANIPTARTAAAAAVIGGKLYVVGGVERVGGRSKALEVYDPAQNTWMPKAPIPTPRSGASAVAFEDRLYVFGGSDGTGGALSAVESYDPPTDRWRPEVSMLLKRDGCGAVVVDGTIYIASGFTNVGLKATSALEIWRPNGKGEIVDPVPAMEVAVGHASVGVLDGNIYVAGGNTRQGEVSNLQLYWTRQRAWYAYHPMPEARWSASGSQVIDGEIWLFGGWTSFAVKRALPQDDVFVFSSVGNNWRRSAPKVEDKK